MLLFLALIVIGLIAGAWALSIRRRDKPGLPVSVNRECGVRLESGLPAEFWLVISNDAGVSQEVKLTIEYASGRDMVERLSIAPGQVRHKVPEPHRVRRIYISAVGYSGLVIYI